MNTTERLMTFAREYRAKQAGTEPPPRVNVMPYERDMSKGAHVCAVSDAMRRGRVALTRKNPASN